MRKIILLIFCSLIFVQNVVANEQQEIQFVYINGSNNNDVKMKTWFYEGVYKLHSQMYDSFFSSDFIYKNLLKNGEYNISSSPEIFFWGDRSNEEIQALNSDLSFTKVFSPRLAQTVRTLLAHYLHDAIWVSHYRNMHPVVEDLHKQVMENYRNNKSVILFGYSAGAFVTYEYMFNKLADINLLDFYNYSKVGEEFVDFVESNPKNNTCIDALIDSGLVIYSADGKLIPNKNLQSFRDFYLKLDEYTCTSCIPQGALKGIINFASPLVLFYSDISNPNYPLTYYNKLLYKYILENDIFWLTVNYADDPLGFPTTKNLSYNDLKNIIDIQINPKKGFLYSKSDVKSRKTFIRSHTSYWATAKKFSRAVVDAYQEGFNLYNICNKKEP